MDIASKIDHTLLRPDCSAEDIVGLCKEAMDYHFFSVCVPPYHTKTAFDFLNGSDVKICTVVGFPLGYQTSSVKLFETEEAIKAGASEIDMVMNISAFKSGDISLVAEEIKEVADLVHFNGAIVKVIIETAYLSSDEIKLICDICTDARVDFVKTSTGFASRGASVEDVKLMRSCLPEHIKIKASGGIKTWEDAVKMIEAGAERLGTSSGLKILNVEKVVKQSSQY
jgi:deoxyribose-phosphate aldolase